VIEADNAALHDHLVYEWDEYHGVVGASPAMRRLFALLTRLEGVFGNLTSAATNEALQAIELEMAPRLSSTAALPTCGLGVLGGEFG